MKKIYYISPFVIIPIIFLIVTLLESAEILEPVVPYFMLGTLFLFGCHRLFIAYKIKV